MAKIHIGTSGFSYVHWEKGVFYPLGLAKNRQLEYYSRHFQTVELNNPFYRLPSAQTFANWRQRTPQDFIFAVKVSRYLTHVKRLKDVQEPWQRFIKNIQELKEKLGVVLFQLPANLQVDLKRLEIFLELITSYKLQVTGYRLKYSFEFRDQSWFCQEIYQLLKKYNISLCLADSAKWPYQEEITADFIYLRLHGSHRLYSSKYTNQELKKWANKIKKWQRQKKEVFVYFNNDLAGYAIKNAQYLQGLLSQ